MSNNSRIVAYFACPSSLRRHLAVILYLFTSNLPGHPVPPLLCKYCRNWFIYIISGQRWYLNCLFDISTTTWTVCLTPRQHLWPVNPLWGALRPPPFPPNRCAFLYLTFLPLLAYESLVEGQKLVTWFSYVNWIAWIGLGTWIDLDLHELLLIFTNFSHIWSEVEINIWRWSWRRCKIELNFLSIGIRKLLGR